MLVLVEGSAESVPSRDFQTSDLCWFVYRSGEWSERSGLAQSSVRAMPAVEGLELAERVEQVALVPDQGAVQEFPAAGLYPALHERVHAGYLDAGGDDLQASVGQQGVEGGRELGVSVAEQESGSAARVLQVHEESASQLADLLAGATAAAVAHALEKQPSEAGADLWPTIRVLVDPDSLLP